MSEQFLCWLIHWLHKRYCKAAWRASMAAMDLELWLYTIPGLMEHPISLDKTGKEDV